MYRKNRKQAVFKRILISWVIILLVGTMIGFFIGRSTKQAIALPVTTETSESIISSFIPTVKPQITQTPIQETSESKPTFELVSLVNLESLLIAHVKYAAVTGQRTDQLMKMEVFKYLQH